MKTGKKFKVDDRVRMHDDNDSSIYGIIVKVLSDSAKRDYQVNWFIQTSNTLFDLGKMYAFEKSLASDIIEQDQYEDWED